MPVLLCNWNSNMEFGGGTPEKPKIHMHSVALEMYVFSIGTSFPRAWKTNTCVIVGSGLAGDSSSVPERDMHTRLAHKDHDVRVFKENEPVKGEKYWTQGCWAFPPQI